MSRRKNETKFIFVLTFLLFRARIDKNETTFILEPNQKERTFRMPKVTQEYIDNKKKMIVSATYELCREKTVSTVTMQDIINRTGLSQGGIYRFYKDIDEILGDMLADMRKRYSLKEELDEIMKEAQALSTGAVTYRICEMLARWMKAELMGVQKIDYEFAILATNTPTRADKILARAALEGGGNKEYLFTKIMEFYPERIAREHLQVKVNANELIGFISSLYAGIQNCSIVYHCYCKGAVAPFYDIDEQYRVMAKTINLLLGIEEER